MVAKGKGGEKGEVKPKEETEKLTEQQKLF